MKVLIRILALTTLVLAGTTLYYGQALMRERARAEARIAPSSMSIATPGVIRSIATGSSQADALAPSPTTTAMTGEPTEHTSECPNPNTLAAARRNLQRFNDPAEHPALRIETRQRLSRSWAPIAAAMRLPDAELQHFLDQMLDGSFRIAQREAACMADPACLCNGRAVMDPLAEERRQLANATLGPVWMARYEAYRNATPERVYVSAMRGNLEDEDQLDEAEAHALALALAEVRHAFVAEVAARGQRIEVSPAGFAVQDFDGDQPPQAILTPPNWDLTAQFNQRLDEVTTRHLTPPQLAAFRALRKERLDNARMLEQLLR